MSAWSGGGQPAPSGRRAMSNGMCIALIVAGAILRFALTARSPHGLNVHVVGVILILAGLLGLILPFLALLTRNRRRRPAPADRQPVSGASRPVYDDGPVLIQDNRHLVRPTQPDRLPDLNNHSQP
jgi:hypothetical protein